MTDEEFKQRWKRLSSMQRRFCLRYLENGMNAKEAALIAGYNEAFVKSPVYKVMRKVNDVLDYLIEKNNIIGSLVKPSWIFDQYLKLYDSSTNEITKQNILRELSKLLHMQSDASKVEITNNLPQTPVEIKFGGGNEK